ncbi:MAG: hypothetical protein JJE18_06975 [Eubacteriaceae bacterium]|nr:hypothetical protein [Eubacteriaceae bacterium]
MNILKNKKLKMWMIVISNIIIPSSGYVFMGRSTRGLLMLLWMFAFGYITSHLNIYNPGIPEINKFFGAIAVWVASIVEVYHLAKKSIIQDVNPKV